MSTNLQVIQRILDNKVNDEIISSKAAKFNAKMLNVVIFFQI